MKGALLYSLIGSSLSLSSIEYTRKRALTINSVEEHISALELGIRATHLKYNLTPCKFLLRALSIHFGLT